LASEGRTGAVIEAKVIGAHGKGCLVKGEERKLCRKKTLKNKEQRERKGREEKGKKRETRP
jgi:hypothetical protein